MHHGWTMDPEGSRDLDDALRFEPSTAHDGSIALHVYIAAPGLDLSTQDPIFDQAVSRRTTRYLAHGETIPMLSAEYEERYSLLPERERDALHVACRIDATGDLDPHSTHVSFVRFCSTARYTYLDAVERPEPFELARKFALLRIASRQNRGALALIDLERGEYTNELGQRQKLVKKEEILGHLIVQEAMIAANEALAQWCKARGVRVCFRVHQGPHFDSDEERDQFDQFLHQSLSDCDEQALELIDSICANRLRPATYSTEPAPHWALKLPAYIHGTSPLRRVHDLISQMQIRAYLHQRPLPLPWGELSNLLHRLEAQEQHEEERSRARFKKRDEKRFFQQLLEDKNLSNKQTRRAISYLLRQEDDRHKRIVLDRVQELLDASKAHHAGTVPVSLIDILLESQWQPARELVLDFLDRHESGWKQVRAHASALYEPDAIVWWEHYKLPHDPVAHQERLQLTQRRQREQRERQQREQRKQQARRKQLIQDPLALFNDLVLRDEVTYQITYDSQSDTDEEHIIVWRATLEVTRCQDGQTQRFEGVDRSKKGIKRALVREAITWLYPEFEESLTQADTHAPSSPSG